MLLQFIGHLGGTASWIKMLEVYGGHEGACAEMRRRVLLGYERLEAKLGLVEAKKERSNHANRAKHDLKLDLAL